MRVNTKQKIMDETICLFNKHGFANVTTSRIAETLGISLGNLTYHFPKKGSLVEAIYQQLVTELRVLLTNYRQHPDFLSIDGQLRGFYKFQIKYRFFYVDTLEIGRAFPKIGLQHQAHINMQIQAISATFAFNVDKGNLINDVPANTYKRVAHSIWMMTALWTYQLLIRGKMDTDSENAMLESAWNLIRPYFTEGGQRVYNELNHPLSTNA
ncbi:MAG: TetR/AcrR family transcriptional regulator [Saprospiraceae bacterium]